MLIRCPKTVKLNKKKKKATAYLLTFCPKQWDRLSPASDTQQRRGTGKAEEVLRGGVDIPGALPTLLHGMSGNCTGIEPC